MELKQKGQNTSLDISQPLTVTMTWTTAADFDLAVVYETQTGQQGIVYFGDKGALDRFPYIALSDDQGIGDTGGNNEEKLEIAQFESMRYIWLFCWDYGKVQNGQPARFKDSDVRLTLTDKAGNSLAVQIDTGAEGNVCCIATIEQQGDEARLINYSQAGTLNGLKTLEQLVGIVQQFVL